MWVIGVFALLFLMVMVSSGTLPYQAPAKDGALAIIPFSKMYSGTLLMSTQPYGGFAMTHLYFVVWRA